jgi:hypothetical protein
MPIVTRIEKDRKRVIAIVTGDLSIDEMINAINSSTKDPDFEPGFDVLSDHTGINEPISTTQAEALARHLDSMKEFYSGSRWAVVTKRAASYGMMRMLSVFLTKVPMELQAFYSFEEAVTWLSLSKNRAE